MGVDPLHEALAAFGGEGVPLAAAAGVLWGSVFGFHLFPRAGDQFRVLELLEQRVQDAGGEAEFAFGASSDFLGDGVPVEGAFVEEGENDEFGVVLIVVFGRHGGLLWSQDNISGCDIYVK